MTDRRTDDRQTKQW